MNRRLLVCLCAGFAACSGSGSDVGPSFPRLPDASSKFVVLDGQGRGVAEARITALGTGVTATTGRNGRGDLLTRLAGRQRLSVDGSAAAATAGDELGAFVFAATFVGDDLPAVVFLPDVAGSSGQPLPTGTQAGATLIDDAATSGARLTIAGGSSIGMANGASSVRVRTGMLQPAHLPGDLPAAAGAAVLCGRGIHVDPPAVTFTAATLDVADDLALPVGVFATLYRLDETSGEWGTVATGVASSGGRLSQAITAGGLYVFGTEVPAAAVAGRVVDAAAAPLPGMLVGVDGRWTTSDGAGRFLVAGIAATTADSAARFAAIEVFAGGSWLPARSSAVVPMNGSAAVAAGDIALDTVPCGNVRVQQVKRARAEPLRRCGISSLYDAVAQAAISDENGQVVFEDVPSRWFGFQEGHPVDGVIVYYAQSIGYVDPGRRWSDVRQFFSESAWLLGSRRTRVLVTDAVGGGPIYDARVVRGSADGAGFVAATREGGTVFVDRPMDGRATVTLSTQRGARRIVHAFTIDTPNGEHLEMPMHQVLRTPLGAFDRHGIVEGTLTGINPARQHRLRATRRLELQEWWDDVFAGQPLPSALPIDLAPAAPAGAFRAGVAAPAGHLAACEVQTAGMVTTLDKVGVIADLAATAGTVTARDLALDHAATSSFTAAGVLGALDPGIAVGDLAFALALEQPSGRVVDVVRGIGGNHAAAGPDLNLTLPALDGDLAGNRWLVALRGQATSAGHTVTQQAMLRIGGGAAGGATLRAAPGITLPAAGATVAASGFAVQFSLPPATLYATLELRSDTGGELLLWQVYLPPTATEFAFRTLPADASQPLVAGRTYSLVLTAFAASDGPLRTSTGPYRDLTAYLQSIGAAERGVDAISSRAIEVTAN